MSRAVVRWRASGKPLALAKRVSLMPSSRARDVMFAAKRASEPPRRSATSVATSLADWTTRARMAWSTVTESQPPRRVQRHLGQQPHVRINLALVAQIVGIFRDQFVPLAHSKLPSHQTTGSPPRLAANLRRGVG